MFIGDELTCQHERTSFSRTPSSLAPLLLRASATTALRFRKTRKPGFMSSGCRVTITAAS
jgi:hypothetical protein